LEAYPQVYSIPIAVSRNLWASIFRGLNFAIFQKIYNVSVQYHQWFLSRFKGQIWSTWWQFIAGQGQIWGA